MRARQDLEALVREAGEFHAQQAFAVLDRLVAAKDPATGLPPLHVRTENGALVVADHFQSGLDTGRLTAGLVMAAEVAKASGDDARATKYLAAAEDLWTRVRRLLAEGYVFVQRRDFNDDGSVKSTEVGERGKSAPGEDNMTRINPRAYAFRGVGELYRLTGKEEYRLEFERFFEAWVKDFHDPVHGGFFIHANIQRPGDHTERDSFAMPEGRPSPFDGRAGVKGNDGTVYGLSSVLLLANDVLATPETKALVREQIDILLHRVHRQNGMIWENYTADWQPISAGWQNQKMEGSSTTSHVAIGGHTAMVPQQIIEGGRQLFAQGAITRRQRDAFIDAAVTIFSEMARDSGAIEWATGAVRNGIRVEEPDVSKRWLRDWTNASWQQHELIQTLLRLRKEGRLEEVPGPDRMNGWNLLAAAETYHRQAYRIPDDYSFSDDLGNPDLYHGPQDALYHLQALQS